MATSRFGFVSRAIDLAHRASADGADDFGDAKTRAGLERHWGASIAGGEFRGVVRRWARRGFWSFPQVPKVMVPRSWCARVGKGVFDRECRSYFEDEGVLRDDVSS